jgi:hypothetical protein
MQVCQTLQSLRDMRHSLDGIQQFTTFR